MPEDPEPGWSGPLLLIEEDGAEERYEPLWELVDGRPSMHPRLTPPQESDAWQHAAEWFQSELDGAEQLARLADVQRTARLVDAYDVALSDLAVRFGAKQARRDSQGVQLFFKKIGLSLGMRPGQVAHRVDTALLLRDRLPRTWDAYLCRAATWVAVDLAAARAQGLQGEGRASYDALASAAVEQTPLASLNRKLRQIRETVQRDTADERATRTAERRTTCLDGGDDGEASFTLTGPAAVLHAIDGAVTKAAIAAHGLDGEQRTMSQLRFDIACDLLVEGVKRPATASRHTLVPGRVGVVPTVVVTVPVLTLLGGSDEPGRLEGYGPIAPKTARRLAGDAPSWFRLLTHPVTGVRLDLDRTVYSPPADLRRWVRLRDEVCRWPGCERPASRCDIDHAFEWHEQGVTAAGNLASLCRSDHLGKSTGMVGETIDADDGVQWDLPWGERITDPPPPPMDPAPTWLLEDDCPF